MVIGSSSGLGRKSWRADTLARADHFWSIPDRAAGRATIGPRNTISISQPFAQICASTNTSTCPMPIPRRGAVFEAARERLSDWLAELMRWNKAYGI
jgi:hypothetical protein